jgi:hypothetical protein
MYEGMTGARFPQLISGETPEEFRKFAGDLKRSCRPVDAAERALVDQMILHGWRLRRLRKAESQLQGNAEGLRKARRLIAAVLRSYAQASRELKRLQTVRAKAVPPVGHLPPLLSIQ